MGRWVRGSEGGKKSIGREEREGDGKALQDGTTRGSSVLFHRGVMKNWEKVTEKGRLNDVSEKKSLHRNPETEAVS